MKISKEKPKGIFENMPREVDDSFGKIIIPIVIFMGILVVAFYIYCDQLRIEKEKKESSKKIEKLIKPECSDVSLIG